jgi:uncharacterized protein affecting Mg2+/Co2+ transport
MEQGESGEGLMSAVPEIHRKPRGEDLVAWLEELAGRVTSCTYTAGNLRPGHRSLLLFPQVPGELGCTRAVTNGVEVIASAIYMPESQSGWTYSIRVRLLAAGEEGHVPAAERGFETCQLRGRHWIITNGATGEEDHVRGDGVVGKYPLLREQNYRDDEDRGRRTVETGHDTAYPFTYQSCSGRVGQGVGGTFGGELVMVPGSIDNPSGPDFTALVATFPLQASAGNYVF